MKKLIKHIALIIFVSGLINNVTAQTHSKMEFSCQTCHACETPTKSNPCLIPCPREKMITVYQLPEQSPDIIVLDKMKSREDLYEPVQFTHRLHAEMAGMSGGCAMCHHYNPPGNVVPCSDCHSAERKREDISTPDLKAAFHRQCMDCHQQWSEKVECKSCHELNSSGKSAFDKQRKASERVHPPIIEPKKLVYNTPSYEGTLVTFFHNEHTNLYKFECVDCHQNESCAKCHDTRPPIEDENILFAVKHKKCASCHDTENNCASCHTNKETAPFNHKQRTGFALTPYHTKINCVSCHTKAKVFSGLSNDCNSCHESWGPENFNHSIVGIELSESHIEWTCDVCHDNRNFTAKPSCNMCHDEDITYPDYEPGERTK